ncbi:hypothetical protein JCM1841_004845 [Sporobolomyces salmonicolor]
MSGTYGLAGLADEDLAVYDFDNLNANSDLAGLLDEDSNAFNDETFGHDLGDAPPVGACPFPLPDPCVTFPPADALSSSSIVPDRDFDFVGSTNRFLGTDAAADAAFPSAKQLEPAASSWMDPLASTPAARALSPWTSLNDDPLLSRAPLLPSAPAPVSQAPAAPSRQFKTLEEVEAELRSAAQAQPQGAQAGRPMTLEEVEAEMMSKARVQAIQQPQQPQFPPGMSPQPQPAYPPHQQFPPRQFPGMSFPGQLPPGMLQQQQQQQQMGHGARPGSLGGLAAFPPGMLPPPASPSPALLRQQLPQQELPGQVFPPLGAVPPGALAPPNLMATLFPPLPSQQGQSSIASVEQQLQYLVLNQHAQHPSLTSAQLQALLQQAHVHAAREQAAGEGAAEGETEEQDKARAGDELIRKVEMRIMEHELAEQKRKKKAMKIASMAKHNGLMSNSDKDFITRIQVSQLLTDDPYADDFYFHIMAAIKLSRQNAMLAATGQAPLMAPGPSGGAAADSAGQGNSNANRRPTRRENAMNKMAQNVQRLVDSAKKRNANEPNTLSLDGALGKIATRTRSAPRPLLQVKPASMAVAPSASSSGSNAPSTGQSLLAGAGLITGQTNAPGSGALAATAATGPLSHRAALAIIEKVYDAVLDLEQLRRIQPALLATEATLKEQIEQMTVEGEVKDGLRERFDNATKAVREGEEKYQELVGALWENLHVMDPLDGCVPHPFISILSVLKGKRILPRAIRHLSPEQTLTLLTLLVASFDTLDVVVDAPFLDQLDTTGSLEVKQRRVAVEAKTEALLNAIIAPVMQVVGQSQLRMVTGMLGLLMDRNDLGKVVRSKPGLAFLTILLSRAESLKQATPAPEAADLQQWHRTFTFLFSSLAASLLPLFPSTRLAASLPFGVAQYQSVETLRPEADLDDEPVWRFLAAVAVCADPDQQQVLVTGVRDKVIEGVQGAKLGKGGPEVAALKIRNVNLLLHALSLDASMIEVD